MSGSISPAPTPGGSPAIPPAGTPARPGQPPIGSSPATGPTQNNGFVAKGIQAAGAILNGMAMVIPLVGAHTPLGQAFAKAMVDIGKHIPPGASSPQGENDFLKQMALRQQQMGPQRAALGAQGAPGGAPGGAPSPAPVPGASHSPPPMAA